VESPEEGARTAEAHWELGGAALLLARDPDDGIDVEPLVEEALAAAAAQGIGGQAVTPFVLSFLHERSGGRTQEVNRDLIVANARLAAQVAVAATRKTS
jgi:pseudouridine-5'-phosphate glycosidase